MAPLEWQSNSKPSDSEYDMGLDRKFVFLHEHHIKSLITIDIHYDSLNPQNSSNSQILR